MTGIDNDPEQQYSEQPADIPVQPEQPPVQAEEKTPFAQGEAQLSGMVSSVLRPQDDREREKIEREIKKRQEQLQHTGSKRFNVVKILLVLLILVLAGMTFFVISNPAITKKVQRANDKIAKKINTNLNIWDIKQVVFGNTFRLKARSGLQADKATLIITDSIKSWQIAGQVVAQDKKSLTWEFLSGSLAKNKYTYKLFVKDSASGELKEAKGSFELK